MYITHFSISVYHTIVSYTTRIQNLTGNFTGNFAGNFAGNLTGDLAPDLTRNLTTELCRGSCELANSLSNFHSKINISLISRSLKIQKNIKIYRKKFTAGKVIIDWFKLLAFSNIEGWNSTTTYELHSNLSLEIKLSIYVVAYTDGHKEKPS